MKLDDMDENAHVNPDSIVEDTLPESSSVRSVTRLPLELSDKDDDNANEVASVLSLFI